MHFKPNILKFSNIESFRPLKLSKSESCRALKLFNLATESTSLFFIIQPTNCILCLFIAKLSSKFGWQLPLH